MRKTKSQKILPWQTKNIILNVITYVLNMGVLFALFIGNMYLNSITNDTNFEAQIKNATNFLHFFVLLLLIVGLTAL